MFVSFSATEDSVKAFAKILALGCALRNDGKLPNKEKLLRTYEGQAEGFLSDFQIRKPLFSRIVGYIANESNLDDDEKFAKDFKDFAKILSKKKSKVEKDISINKVLYQYIYKAASYMLRGAPTSWDYVVKNANHLGDPSITTMFVAEHRSTKKVHSKLLDIARDLTGNSLLESAELSPEQKAELKETNPDGLKAYNMVRRELMAIPKNFILNLVRSSGDQLLRVAKIIQELERADIEHSIPSGFVGYMDEDMNYYTIAKKRLNGTPAGDVRMNEEYDPKSDNTYVCKAKAEFAQDYTSIYTMDYKRAKVNKKFDIVREFAPKMNGLRKRWLSDIRSGTDTRTGLAALLCELIFQTSGRVGSKSGSTKGKQTYGMSVLLRKHYKKRGNDRLFEYIGKKGQPQKHLYPADMYISKLIINDLDKMAEGLKRDDYLIAYRGKPLSNKFINDYLKSIGAPDGVTIHKFRTLKGTALTQIILKNHRFKNMSTSPSSKVANDWITKALMPVAKELGHFSNGNLTVGTAIANYIDPSLLEDFFEEVGARPNAMIQKAIDSAKEA